MDGDSRSHVEKDDASIEVRNSVMIATSLRVGLSGEMRAGPRQRVCGVILRMCCERSASGAGDFPARPKISQTSLSFAFLSFEWLMARSAAPRRDSFPTLSSTWQTRRDG